MYKTLDIIILLHDLMEFIMMIDNTPNTTNVYYGFLVFFAAVAGAFVYVLHSV